MFSELTALASRPAIEECDEILWNSSPLHKTSLCETSTSRKYAKFNLNCKVTGFKPNISLEWRKDGESISLLNDPRQSTLEDGTFERTITISVDAKEEVDQNFTCSATGIAVNGSSAAVITVLALPDITGKLA